MTATILTCKCGVKVRVPADAADRAFRCPKCKAPLEVPVTPAAAVVVSSQPLGARSLAECPICQTAVFDGEPVIECESCDQVHHETCWTEIGGCGTYGCAQAPAVDKADDSASAPLSAWGDTKKCPACGETIKAIAMRCRYCRTDFHSVDPLSVADLRRHSAKSQSVESAKKGVVAVFVVSIIGLLAPLMLIISLLYVSRNREQLAKSGPLFAIMGWAAVALSAIYSLLMLAFFVIA